MITAERLRELLTYEPETGIWCWIDGPYHNSRLAGKIAGTVRADGRRSIRVGGAAYFSTRLAWLYMTGSWPENEIDHKDRDTTNDRWSNLRAVTSAQNKHNTGLKSNNTSGFIGVSWSRAQEQWRADINGLNLGFFDNIEEAIIARDCAATELHGSFAQLNTEFEAA